MGFRTFKRELKLAHYYENDPALKSAQKTLNYVQNGDKFVFTTDLGVFSNKALDYGSTLLIREVMKRYDEGDILDVGCGYGFIGIVLARNYTRAHVSMVDINERAVSLANINIAANNISNAEALVSDGYANVVKKYRYIVINPPIRAGKQVYYPLLAGAKDYLTKDGTLMFVIKKQHGAKSAAKFVSETYGNCTLLQKDSGYYVYAALSN